MVVDDSLTVRKVTQRLLEREGYHVLLAKDGVDALEQLQSTCPDMILVDIEMPRMDGFDLTRNVRGDAATTSLPIIMITSRTADKHRNFALGLGVDAYFGKPFQEDALLAAIEGLLESGRKGLSAPCRPRAGGGNPATSKKRHCSALPAMTFYASRNAEARQRLLPRQP